MFENSLTGYETLKIQRMGDMEKIVFYDNEEKENRGTDIEMRNGKATFMFKSADFFHERLRLIDSFARHLQQVHIASGYRKDKIWLHRTKPGKRDYGISLAVDNSERVNVAYF